MISGLILILVPLLQFSPAGAADSCTPPGTTYGTDTLTITIPLTTTYTIWTRLLAPPASTDTALLDIDSETTCFNIGGAAQPVNTWNWINYADSNTSSLVQLSLTAGQHTLEFIGTQQNVEIDRVEALGDSNCVPIGTGNNCAAATAVGNTLGTSLIHNINGSSIASVQNADGTLELFAIGSDNNLYANRETATNSDTWNGWYQLQGGSARSLTATRLANGKLALFFVAGDGTTHYYFQTAASTDTWTAMEAMHTGLNEISAGINNDGTIELFAVGNDKNIYAERESAASADAWNGWYQLQGGSGVSVSAAAYANGRLGVFFVSGDGRVHYYNQAAANTDSWTGMEAINAGLYSISVAPNADGTLELFAVGNDGNNYAKRETSASADAWNGWYQLQGGNSSSLTAAPMQNGKLGSFFVAKDGAIHYYFQTAASTDNWAGMEALAN